MGAPWTDCPPCPSCSLRTSITAYRDQGTMLAPWLWCPACGGRHIDEGAFAEKPHHTHACQHCGMTWRPSVVATYGVRFLPGFKNETP